jgi:hypothetical protein
MRQIAVFQGVDAEDVEKSANQWINESKVYVLDVKVNVVKLNKEGEMWYTMTVVYNK